MEGGGYYNEKGTKYYCPFSILCPFVMGLENIPV